MGTKLAFPWVVMTNEHVHVCRHPLVRDALAGLRDATTPPSIFRRHVALLSRMLCYEATADLNLQPVTVRTPMTECPAERLADRVGLVPILRAGLGMAEAMLQLIPEASVWHLGLYREHDTLEAKSYYERLPERPNFDVALVLDPMLATGGTAVLALRMLKRWPSIRVKFVGLIGAPEGVRVLQTAHPEVPIYLGALDSHLNEVGYIVPGLGDAGDRQFGTAHA